MMRYIMLVCITLISLTSSPTKAEQQTNDQFDCLVEAVYFEARGESLKGIFAVVEVILNRVAHRSFPNTVCTVTTQGRYWNSNPIKHKCHFSYFCDGKSDKIVDSPTYQRVRASVGQGLKDWVVPTDVLYYHNNKVSPYWKRKFKRKFKIGNHIFYGEK